MAKQIFSSILTVIIVFAIAALIGWGSIFATTGSPNFLDRNALPSATTSQPAAGPADDNLGAVLGDDTDSNTAVQQQARIEQMRRDTVKGLEMGLFQSLLAGFLIATLWVIYAGLRKNSIGGISSMRSAQGVWTLGLLATVAFAALFAWLALRSGGQAQAVSPSRVFPYGVGAIVLTAFAYHLSTVFGAPVVLRASVPLATMIAPVRRVQR